MCNKEKNAIQDSFDDLELLRESMTKIHRHKNFKEELIRKEDSIIHMENAYAWAKRRCYAQRRKVGAILVKGNRPISSGFNGTKSGHPNICEKDGVTIKGVTHAEKNALFKLMEENTDSPNNSTIFVTTAPCENCAEDLLLAKVSAVYFTEMYRNISGIEELIKNGVSVYHINLKLVEEFDKKTAMSGEHNYNNLPDDFLTTIYKSTKENDVDQKIESIHKLRELFKSYKDGLYHSKFYNVA